MTENASARPWVTLGLAALFASCGAHPSHMTGQNTSGAVHTGWGRLAVSLGAQHDDVDGTRGGGHGNSGFTSLTLTFDALRVYPECESEHGGHDHEGHTGGHGGGHDGGCPGGGMPNGGDHGGGMDGGADGGADPACDPLQFSFAPLTTDVLLLGDELTLLLPDLELPAGRYCRLDLHVAGASGVTSAGVEVTVEIPADRQYATVPEHFEIRDGEPTEFDVSIDPARSVRETPAGSGRYELLPMLRGSGHGHGTGGGGHGDGDHHGGGHGGMH